MASFLNGMSPPRRRPSTSSSGDPSSTIKKSVWRCNTFFLASTVTLLLIWFVASQRQMDFINDLYVAEQQQQHQIPHRSEFHFVMTNERAPECKALSSGREVDFTLVTQTSANRLWLLDEHCRRWGPHPISVTVGGPNLREREVYDQIRAMPSCDVAQVKVTLVTDFRDDLDYPVNRMRNVAVASIATSHAVYIDIDFLMSDHVYDKLRTHRDSLLDVKTALVMPAFELLSFCELGTIEGNATCTREHLRVLPSTKKQARKQYIPAGATKYAGGITAFDRKFNRHGHESTDYTAWFDQEESVLEPLECVTSDKYEPYLVFRNCKDVPPFPEDFTGFGRNKMVWVQQLRRAGWKFLRMGGGFLTHLPHDKSDAFQKWRSNNKSHRTNAVNEVSESFRRWMIEEVPDQHVVPYCNASLPEKLIWYPTDT